MQLQLSQKERTLLEDIKSQEEICIIKYQNYSNQATDPQLKQLFTTLSQEEQKHYDTVNQMLQGQEPNLNASQPSGTSSSVQSQQTSYNGVMANSGDKILCTDLLSTEKFVSSVYDTSIFEAASPVVRQALQHIQKDEQKHGEQIFNYMNAHGMYTVKY